MTSPGNLPVTDSVPLQGGGSPDWVMIEFYNTDSDSYPALVAPPRGETDFYIADMTLTGIPEPGTGVLLAMGASTLLGLGTRRRR
jgi:hypothetical protein